MHGEVKAKCGHQSPDYGSEDTLMSQSMSLWSLSMTNAHQPGCIPEALPLA